MRKKEFSKNLCSTFIVGILDILDISPTNFTFLKTFDSEFSYLEVWFMDHNSKPAEIEDKISITLVINQSVKYKE